ncbi:MAG: hypothetical protein AB7G21_08185 [Dehalococcoidia bacterium]
MLRILTIVTLVMIVYLAFEQWRAPSSSVARGRLARIRFIARRARLVALIYVCVIVLSGIARIAGWIE